MLHEDAGFAGMTSMIRARYFRDGLTERTLQHKQTRVANIISHQRFNFFDYIV